MIDRVSVDTRISRWTLTPLGWIVVFLAALFLSGFFLGIWWAQI